MVSRWSKVWTTKYHYPYLDWARKSTKSYKKQQVEYIYLFDSVCPAKGIGEELVVPSVNWRNNSWAPCSQITEKGRHAIVIMDGAGWHTDDIANLFNNLSIIKLPPYSPELNPIEQVWSWLRQHYLANQSFADDNNIVDKVYVAWNRFNESALRITKMCSRD